MVEMADANLTAQDLKNLIALVNAQSAPIVSEKAEYLRGLSEKLQTRLNELEPPVGSSSEGEQPPVDNQPQQ